MDTGPSSRTDLSFAQCQLIRISFNVVQLQLVRFVFQALPMKQRLAQGAKTAYALVCNIVFPFLQKKKLLLTIYGRFLTCFILSIQHVQYVKMGHMHLVNVTLHPIVPVPYVPQLSIRPAVLRVPIAAILGVM